MTTLNDIIRGAARSNVLGASAFAESVRADLADEIEKALTEATGGPDHTVVADARGVWTMRHPIHERFEGDADGLFDCRYNTLVQVAAEQGAFSPGTRHRVEIDRGVLVWEEIE